MADMQIDRVLFLSTSHLTRHTDRAIIEDALHDMRHHGATGGRQRDMPASMLFPCDDGFYGYMIWADFGFVTSQAEEEHKELQRVIEFAVRHDCQWIRFDVDGPVIDELPTFDHDDLDECADCGGSTAPGTPEPHVCADRTGSCVSCHINDAFDPVAHTEKPDDGLCMDCRGDEQHNAPSFDHCEAAGLDGTLRTVDEPHTWEDVARAALAKLEGQS